MDVKCKYCDREATRTLVWLKDKRQRPARIKLPWCGCDLMTALRRIWACPYQVQEGRDYEVLSRPPAPPLTQPIGQVGPA